MAEHMERDHENFWYLVLKKKLYSDVVFGFRDFGFWDFCILLRNILRFRPLGCPFPDG